MAEIDVADEVSIEFLEAFAAAFNRHDTDALMGMMTPDCRFDHSSGDAVWGRRYEGREAVRAGFESVFATFPDGRWNDAVHFVAGDRGVSEWRFTGTTADGQRTEVHGCDVFTFRDGRIHVKDSFRKNRSAR